MEFKPSKSRSISIIKGKLTAKQFYISGEPIPTVLEKPIKSLGQWYNADLNDATPGTLKLWCFQFGLLPRILWRLTMYELSLNHAIRLERLVSSYIKKWLGLPKCLNSVGLYSDGILSLPIASLVDEFKCAKVRLEMSLTDSRDPIVRGTAPTLATGRKWTPATSVLQAKSALRHRDVVGHVQQGRGGFGLGAVTHRWQQASVTEC
ncbi:acyl-CoA thioesteraes 11 [Sarotherodon galilaeus]